MSDTMNQRERFINCLTYEKIDRIPNMEMGVWGETLDRWHTEGMAWWVRDLLVLKLKFPNKSNINRRKN